jgi:hypothetical protein
MPPVLDGIILRQEHTDVSLLFAIWALKIKSEGRVIWKRQEAPELSGVTMPSDFAMSSSEVLNSWKEVALYLGRGVRTVQRWEQELGLPVRRPRGKARSAVLALKSELDSWLLQTAQTPTPVAKTTLHSHHYQNTEILTAKTRQLLVRSLDLCERSRYLTEQINRAVALACRLSRVPGDKRVASAVDGASIPPP